MAATTMTRSRSKSSNGTVRRSRTPSENYDASDSLASSSNAVTAEEKALLKKLDWRIVPWIFILYFLSVEDRANVGYAMTMNKQAGHDLASTAGLTARENNIGLGLFYVAYIVCIFIYTLSSRLFNANLHRSIR